MNLSKQQFNAILQVWLFITVFLMLLGSVFIFSNKGPLTDIDVSNTEYTSLISHSKAGACLGDFTNDGIVDVEDLSLFIKFTGFSPSTEEQLYLTGELLSLNLDTTDTNYWDIKDYLIFEQNFEDFSIEGNGICTLLRESDI